MSETPEMQGMSEEYASRMRAGLAAMAPQERVRERRRRRSFAAGAAGALVMIVGVVLGVQVLAPLGAADREVAVPTSTPTPTPSVPQTPEPSETPETTPEAPAPPSGFEGVAAGVPVVTDTMPLNSGDTGAAGDVTIIAENDIYVRCQGVGSVTVSFTEFSCAEEPPGTVWVFLGIITYEDSPPAVVQSPDFSGDVYVMDVGVAPIVEGLGGSMSVWAPRVDGLSIGGIPFTFTWTDGESVAIELAAWGVLYSPGQLVPRIDRAQDAGTYFPIRFVPETGREAPQ